MLSQFGSSAAGIDVSFMIYRHLAGLVIVSLSPRPRPATGQLNGQHIAQQPCKNQRFQSGLGSCSLSSCCHNHHHHRQKTHSIRFATPTCAQHSSSSSVSPPLGYLAHPLLPHPDVITMFSACNAAGRQRSILPSASTSAFAITLRGLKSKCSAHGGEGPCRPRRGVAH